MERHGEEEGMHAATHLTPVSNTRLWAGRIMNAHLPEGEKMDVSPHVLRHTFLRKLAETKGVHYAREASGHQSDRYIWRYVKPDQQTLADAIDELE
jgi:integrase